MTGPRNKAAVLVFLHKNIGEDVWNLIRALKHRSGARLQLLNQLFGLKNLLLGNIQLRGDVAVVALCQHRQVIPHDIQGGTGVVDALELKLQTLGQVGCPYAGGFQSPQDGQALLQLGDGDGGAGGEFLQGNTEIAVVIQTGGQIANDLRGTLVQAQLVDLTGEKPKQGLLQAALG